MIKISNLTTILDIAEHHIQSGNPSDAIKLCELILGQDPDNGEAHFLLGNIAFAENEFERAANHFSQALSVLPGTASLCNNLGLALKECHRLAEAADAFKQAVAREPTYALAHYNLGIILQETGDHEGALASLRAAYEYNPGNLDALSKVALILHQQGDFFGAVDEFKRILAINPDLHMVLNNLGNSLKYLGLIDEALHSYRRAFELMPSLQAPFSNYLMTMILSTRFTPLEIYAEHRHWAEIQADGYLTSLLPYSNDHDPERRIKLGYISRDFKSHPVAFFIEPILANHDLEKFDIYCYCDVDNPDQVTRQFELFPVRWRNISAKPHEEVEEMVRTDGIDILVDLAGHTAGNRLLLFARKPAPVQVTWLGYPATTGLKTIDYRISDGYADPPGMTEAFHSEQLYRLPGPFICFRPAINSPEVAPLPSARTGCCTFAAFNHFSKVTPQAIACWSEILAEVPGSRLIIKSLGLDHERMQEHVNNLFVKNGISPERLKLIGRTFSIYQHLELFSEVDISLDTFPYNGTTTTCESLWMGVPVVTIEGNAHVSRVGYSILRHVGLPQFIAPNETEYVRLAVELAGNRDLLGQLRPLMRTLLLRSPLLDAKGVTRNLEQAYREMWRQHCQTH